MEPSNQNIQSDEPVIKDVQTDQIDSTAQAKPLQDSNMI